MRKIGGRFIDRGRPTPQFMGMFTNTTFDTTPDTSARHGGFFRGASMLAALASLTREPEANTPEKVLAKGPEAVTRLVERGGNGLVSEDAVIGAAIRNADRANLNAALHADPEYIHRHPESAVKIAQSFTGGAGIVGATLPLLGATTEALVNDGRDERDERDGGRHLAL